MVLLTSACSSMDSEKPANETTNTSEDQGQENMDNAEKSNMENGNEENDSMEKSNEEGTQEESSSEGGDKKKEENDKSEPAKEGEEVTSDIASPLLKEGETVTYSFPEKGVYNVHCDPHPIMKMKITVEEGAETSEHLELEIKDYAYSEKEVVIAPGTSITWTNKDFAEHNVAIVVE